MARLCHTAPHARLSGNDLPRFGERSIVRRRCDRSCAYRHDTAASAFPVRLIEAIKKPSSKWIKALGARYRGFFWQRGYGIFSVSPSQLDAVLEYVKRQEKHHRTHT